MPDGVVASLNELIRLKRYAQSKALLPNARALRSGHQPSKQRGRGMDFSETRHYQAGDEIRHMEWRVTARTGKPHVKMYQEERERPVVLLTDFNPSMIFGTRLAFKSVVAARLAALLAWTSLQQGDRVGGFFFSAKEHSEFPAQGRESKVLPLLASLSHYTHQKNDASPPKKLSDALMRLRRVLRPGSLLVVLSDFYLMDAECEKQFNRLREHNDLLAYHICDPLELAPPLPEQYPMTDGHQEILLDTRAPSVRAAYEDFCTQRINQLQEQMRLLRIQYVQVTSSTSLPQLVRQTFPRRNRG
jgi:uncharacterized protein (DUF58 family)